MREPIEVTAATEIDAPAETVWRVLTDLPGFRAWNPFIRAARGDTRVGDVVHVRVRASLGVPLWFHATVTERDEAHRLRWEGHVLAPWLGTGDHTFAIEPLGSERSRFVQRERFSGVLPQLAPRLLAREAGRGFAAMNLALKARAEHAACIP